MALKDWKKTNLRTQPKSLVVYEGVSASGKVKILWIQKSNVRGWYIGGINGRGYIRNIYFKTKSAALKGIKEYMRKR